MNFPRGAPLLDAQKILIFLLGPAAHRLRGGAPLLDAHEVLGPLPHYWPVLHIKEVLHYWGVYSLLQKKMITQRGAPPKKPTNRRTTNLGW